MLARSSPSSVQRRLGPTHRHRGPRRRWRREPAHIRGGAQRSRLCRGAGGTETTCMHPNDVHQPLCAAAAGPPALRSVSTRGWGCCGLSMRPGTPAPQRKRNGADGARRHAPGTRNRSANCPPAGEVFTRPPVLPVWWYKWPSLQESYQLLVHRKAALASHAAHDARGDVERCRAVFLELMRSPERPG